MIESTGLPKKRSSKSVNYFCAHMKDAHFFLVNLPQSPGVKISAYDGNPLSDGILNNPDQFFRIKGLFYKRHSIFNSMIAVNSTDHNNRRVF